MLGFGGFKKSYERVCKGSTDKSRFEPPVNEQHMKSSPNHRFLIRKEGTESECKLIHTKKAEAKALSTLCVQTPKQHIGEVLKLLSSFLFTLCAF